MLTAQHFPTTKTALPVRLLIGLSGVDCEDNDISFDGKLIKENEKFFQLVKTAEGSKLMPNREVYNELTLKERAICEGKTIAPFR